MRGGGGGGLNPSDACVDLTLCIALRVFFLLFSRLLTF